MLSSPRRPAATLAALILSLSLALPALAASPTAGFLTDRPAMLDAVAAGATVKPLISVGDMVGDYRFESLPDGLAIWQRDREHIDLYVNHETSKVPFGGFADYRNSEVSHLTLKRGAGKVLSGELVIPSRAGYQRFCSNFIAGPEAGFERPLLLTNEEATDVVLRQEASWPVPAGQTGEQAGMVVAVDLMTGDYRSIPGMGRHNHENAVALPGYDQVAVLSGDDTFSAPSSQLYMYLAPNGQAVWNDTGHLYAFVPDDASQNDYGDIVVGEHITGTFKPIDDAVADGGQTGLESASNAMNAFQFIRVEDIAYDRTDHNVVYFADTGEPRAIPQASPGTRLARGPGATATSPGTRGLYMNGRIWKMVLDPVDPTIVTSLSILANSNFDLGGYGNPDVVHQPDNVESTLDGLLVQEDPGAHNSSNVNPTAYGFAEATNARVWWYDFDAQQWSVVAEVDQSHDAPTAPRGTFESSGIVDASWAFGPGAFLVTVQAHGVNLDPPGLNPKPPADPFDIGGQIFRERLEDGQLLLLRLPQD